MGREGQWPAAGSRGKSLIKQYIESITGMLSHHVHISGI